MTNISFKYDNFFCYNTYLYNFLGEYKLSFHLFLYVYKFCRNLENILIEDKNILDHLDNILQ